jgi:hypothetical protein
MHRGHSGFPVTTKGRPSRPAPRWGVVRRWLAAAGGGAALTAALACSSTVGSGVIPPGLQQAYLLVANSGSVSAILTIDLSPPVQTHVPIASCRELPLNVPMNDSVKVVITDSTATASTVFEVPFYEAGVWAVDCAPDHGNPVALGAIGHVSNTC